MLFRVDDAAVAAANATAAACTSAGGERIASDSEEDNLVAITVVGIVQLASV